MENDKRRCANCAEDDRISNLLEHLIRSILERLPVQDAVSTSILSKKWRYRWTTMRELVFDEQFFKKFGKHLAFGRNGFIRIINHVLILHEGPILKFYLHLPVFCVDRFQEIDHWMLFLSRNGVKELALTNSSRPYDLPSHVFSCRELEKLELERCIFKPPREIQGFLNLEDLSLEKIDFVANSCGTMISLPQLKYLYLHTCTNVYNFNIKATKLETLNVFNCPDAMLLQLLDSQYLFSVRIHLGTPIKDSARVERKNLARSLSNFPEIEDFTFDDYFLKFLGEGRIKISKRLPRAVNSLIRLSLRNFNPGCIFQLRGALCLLQSSPNLESLCLSLMQKPQMDLLGSASSLELESSQCLDQTLNQLQDVEITNLEGLKIELLFIKLLLAHSPKLEKMTIRPCGTSSAYKRHNIAKDVMRFPRASPIAEMIYLDPEP